MTKTAGTEAGPDTRDLADAALVARCAAGDESAWQALVTRHSGLVWAVALRAGLSREDASDVFQGSWTVAVEDLSRLRDPARFSSWIARVTRHQAMRIRRRYGISRRAFEQLGSELEEWDLPDDELAALEERQRFTAALASVGQRCGDLLTALYYEQPTPSYERIARRLKMKIGSIGPTRARCLAKLRDELGKVALNRTDERGEVDHG